MDLHQIVNIELARSTNYLPMGYWDKNVTYSLTDMGVPFVKVPDGTGLQFSVYALKSEHSTKGANPATMPNEWRLIESAEFIYMQDAYIEKLQAILITAQTIEALDISVKRLTTPFLTVDNSDATYDSSRRVYKVNNDLNLSANSFDTYGRDIITWIELPEDVSYIGTRVVILNANFPPYTYTSTSTAPTVVCVSSGCRSNGVGVGGKPKTGLLSERNDPYAISFLGCMVEFICVPRVIGGLTYPYWVATNWSESIGVEEWT